MRLLDIDDDTLRNVVSSLSYKGRAAAAQSCTQLRHIISQYDARRPWKLLRRSEEYLERGYGPPREQLLAHAFTGLASDNIAKQHLWILVYVVRANDDGALSEHNEIRVYDLEEDAKLVASVVLAAEDLSELPDPNDSDGDYRQTKILRDLLRPAEPDNGRLNCVCSTPGGYWSVRFLMGTVGCTVPATAEQRRLGIDSEGITPAPFVVSAACNRVPVFDGHLETVTVKLADGAAPTMDEVAGVLAGWRGMPQEQQLPSAPERPIEVLTEADRPQPARDAWRNGGMSTMVGRLRPDPIGTFKMVIMGHNTVRGAAGAAILNAEAFVALGHFDRYR